MTVSILLDENVEHEVYHRLQKFGHDVEHIDFHQTLHKGNEDRALARYSLENEVLIVTYDDDFETIHDESDYWGVLFFSDNEWSANRVADTIHEVLDYFDESTLQQMNLIGREWL